jgi:hypothetical protein
MSGPPKPKCGAERRNSNGPCKRGAGAGTDHPGWGRCSWHGGCSPGGEMRAREDQVRAEVARLDLPPTDDPIGELARVTAQVIAWKDAMAAQVNRLTALRYESEGEGGGEQLRSEVALFERALDRCEKFLTAMAKLSIDERLAKVTEKQAQMAEQALLATLGEMGMDVGRQQEAREKMARHLRVA